MSGALPCSLPVRQRTNFPKGRGFASEKKRLRRIPHIGTTGFSEGRGSWRCGDASPALQFGTIPNVLLITVDDMNWDSVGVFGCPVPETTPHIDRLASQGVRFEHAHVNISVCQPCRAVIATGRYSHRNGAEGFERVSTGIPTLMQTLQEAGYKTGILSKVTHSTPHADFAWDDIVVSGDLNKGRSPELFYECAKRLFTECERSGVPFYLMANIQDPHRPFFDPLETQDAVLPSRVYSPDEIHVPGFLPDLPRIREELASYFSSVRRADDTVGALLKALTDAGQEKSTIVCLLSDNGMSVPFAKGNCYPASTKTPWIVRWPGVIAPARVDEEHFISTIDFMLARKSC